MTRTVKICAAQGDQVEDDEVGGTCGMFVGQEKFVYGFVGKPGRHRDSWEA
jgi:hypothetical protein